MTDTAENSTTQHSDIEELAVLFGDDGVAKTVRNSKVMVVDDQEYLRDLVAACLKTGGYENLCFASNGVEALEVAQKERPDLIILDLVMPEKDGFEFCEIYRSDVKNKSVPILVLTSVDNAEERARVFEVGASDVVSKPISSTEIIARTRIHIERSKLFGKLKDYYNQMEEQMIAIQAMQQELLPDQDRVTALTNTPGLSIDSWYEASDLLAGDFWGVKEISEKMFAIYNVDFSGHGALASLNTFRLQSVMESENFDWSDPEEVMMRVNRFLVDAVRTGTFATMIYCVFDLEKNEITYTASGSPYPLLTDHKGEGSWRLLESKGLPLGVSREATFEVRSCKFEPGNSFMLYSDGLTEAPKPDCPALSDTELGEVILAIGNESAQAMVPGLRRVFFDRLQAPIPDDITVLVVNWAEE